MIICYNSFAEDSKTTQASTQRRAFGTIRSLCHVCIGYCLDIFNVGKEKDMLKLLALLKGHVLLAALGGTILVGGATAAFAATPAGQHVVQSALQGAPATTPTAAAQANGDNKPTSTPDNQNGKDNKGCPSLPEAQNLATAYHLSTASTGDAVKDICALHKGTFAAKTVSGETVKISHVYGNGEINQLLTYAQYLATKDSTNADSKLTDTNVTQYLAAALKSCGTSPLAVCLKTNIPNYQPGNSDSSNSNKPTATPTNNGNKPTATPTDNGNKPTSTPTNNGRVPTATPVALH